MAQIGNITFDCVEPRKLAQFWAATLGYQIEEYPEQLVQLLTELGRQAELEGEVAIRPADGRGPRLYFQRVPEPKTVKNRVHLDINAADSDAEVDRLIGLGAQLLRRTERSIGPFSERWTVMADPEGNEFCVQHLPGKQG